MHKKKIRYVAVRIPFLAIAIAIWYLQVKYLGTNLPGNGQAAAWLLNAAMAWWLLATVFTEWWKDEFWHVDTTLQAIVDIPLYALPQLLNSFKNGVVNVWGRIPAE